MSRLIDADELMHNLLTAIEVGKRNNKPTDELVAVLNYVNCNAEKSYFVPVIHGHWERIPNTPTWKCSICGYEITGFIDRDGLTPMDCKVNYCSRCGSKMEEVTE